jgi:hypothetical protein
VVALQPLWHIGCETTTTTCKNIPKANNFGATVLLEGLPLVSMAASGRRFWSEVDVVRDVMLLLNSATRGGYIADWELLAEAAVQIAWRKVKEMEKSAYGPKAYHAPHRGKAPEPPVDSATGPLTNQMNDLLHRIVDDVEGAYDEWR